MSERHTAVGPICWLNGRLLPETAAAVSASDHGLLYGHGAFETIRVHRGRPTWTGRHLARLRASFATLGLDPASLPPAETLTRALQEVVSANGIREGSLRVTATAGPGAPRPWAPAGPPTVLVTGRDGLPYPPALYDRGYRGRFAPWPRACSPLCAAKTTSYVEALLARRVARAAGADEALWTDGRGFVLEGTMTNVFAVSRGEVVTPPADGRLLPGVARAVLLDSLPRAGIATREGPLSVEALLSADEAFLTSVLLGPMPLVSVDGHAIGSGVPGPVTARVRDVWTGALALAAKS
ncbi:MAG: aminotransferase class IV family protein [Clostridia bacterium]|nr:aminotransferase class IV family protein [Clostridia bacterium]